MNILPKLPTCEKKRNQVWMKEKSVATCKCFIFSCGWKGLRMVKTRKELKHKPSTSAQSLKNTFVHLCAMIIIFHDQKKSKSFQFKKQTWNVPLAILLCVAVCLFYTYYHFEGVLLFFCLFFFEQLNSGCFLTGSEVVMSSVEGGGTRRKRWGVISKCIRLKVCRKAKQIQGLDWDSKHCKIICCNILNVTAWKEYPL